MFLNLTPTLLTPEPKLQAKSKILQVWSYDWRKARRKQTYIGALQDCLAPVPCRHCSPWTPSLTLALYHFSDFGYVTSLLCASVSFPVKWGKQ